MKSNKNPRVVKDLVMRSFAMRRVEILENSMDLNEIFTKFTFLQETDKV